MSSLAKFALVGLCVVVQVESQTQQSNYPMVQIKAFTTDGDSIKQFTVRLSQVEAPYAKFTASGRDFAELKIPPGDYELTTWADGYGHRSELIRVYGPKVMRIIAFPPIVNVDMSEPGPISKELTTFVELSGKVENFHADSGKLRVRLVALYGNELDEATVDSSGAFQFPLAEQGVYLLITVADLPNGVEILDSRPIQLGGLRFQGSKLVRTGTGKETVTINLQGKNGNVLMKRAPAR